MQLKPEVIRSLEREKKLSDTAILRLEERCRALETKYGWSTEEFLRKFNAGEIGDEQDYFLCYPLSPMRSKKHNWNLRSILERRSKFVGEKMQLKESP